MDETKFLERAGVLVTSTRIDIDGQTFAIRNVGSVKMAKAAKTWPVWLMLALAAGSLPSRNWWVVGMFLGFAGFQLYRVLNVRALVLVTGGGEQTAYTGKRTAVEEIRAAVAQAIASR